ncbi:hypothetical protein IJG98_01000 [Candidatus Saccharibacteria bacterium]|nr:hypothetical protein [Candidatus Saccharibacteria bacterium]
MFNQPPSMPPVVPAGIDRPAAPSVAPSGASKVAGKDNSSFVKTIIIIFLALLTIGGACLAIYFYNEYKAASADVNSQVAAAVTAREKEITDELEAKFAEREKQPYNTFGGPADYGSLNFKYPRTWSVYVAKDAAKGGDFEAYLHPGQVNPISNTEPIALRVTIKSESFETANSRYKSLVQSGKLTSSVISVGGTDANRYDGTLSTNLVGSVVIFKIRDKTVTLETDAEIYREDFAKILETVTFNE